MYEKLDELLPKLKNRIRNEFNSLSVMGFDELNVINTKKVTQEMFERLKRENDKAYLKIAKSAYKDAGGAKTKIDEDWVAGVLSDYNLITGYLYFREAERKRLRLSEEILTAREYSDRKRYDESLRRTANLWWKQTNQYGIDIVDRATLQAYRDAGIKRVRWVTRIDGRECVTCKERNGNVYKLSEVPSKPHYGCRCYLEPVR